MTLRQCPRIQKLGGMMLIVVAASRMASATIDMTGYWLVHEALRDDYPTLCNIVQTGDNVTFTCELLLSDEMRVGTIDNATGVVSFPNDRPPYYLSDFDALTLQVAADGQSFTGIQYLTFCSSVPGDCMDLTHSLVGSPCTDSGNTGDCAMIPGGGPSDNDCLQEWITPRAAVPRPNAPGGTQLTCTDDDPACDFGPQSEPGCTFYIGMCFNVADAALPCTARGVRIIRFRRPSVRARWKAAAPSRSALEGALVEAGGQVQGVCLNHLTVGTPCVTNSDCSPIDGVCNRVVTMPSNLSEANLCTPLTPISVPLGRHGRVGKLTLRVSTQGKAADVSAPDTDRLTLICRPHP
jgi:hypothetical protein